MAAAGPGAMPSIRAISSASAHTLQETGSGTKSGIEQRKSGIEQRNRGKFLFQNSSKNSFSAGTRKAAAVRGGGGGARVGSSRVSCCSGINRFYVGSSNAQFGWSALGLLGLDVSRLAAKRVPSTPLKIAELRITAIQKTDRTNAMARNASEPLKVAERDLLVVGPGVLGSFVAQLWLEGNKESAVVGQTNTTTHHEELKSLGIVPVVKDAINEERFPYVIFCAPPSGSLDYPAEVRAAAQRWNGEGSLLFTSSSALYDVNDNGSCDEQSAPLVPKGRGPRTDTLLNAEAEILKVGGNVVRLAGLYALNRGAHTFFLSKGSVEARPDHILNLIHYEDAAALCMVILKRKSRGQIYMGCDNFPVSRQELMDAVNKSGKFEQKFKEFTGSDGTLGKRMNNNPTRLATGWKPKYESFPSFLGVMIADCTH